MGMASSTKIFITRAAGFRAIPVAIVFFHLIVASLILSAAVSAANVLVISMLLVLVTLYLGLTNSPSVSR